MNTIRIASAGGSTALEVNGKVYGPGIEEIEFSAGTGQANKRR